jgi:hypothetical protein
MIKHQLSDKDLDQVSAGSGGKTETVIYVDCKEVGTTKKGKAILHCEKIVIPILD